MNEIKVKHQPDYENGVLGCRGYAPTGFKSFFAGDEGNYIEDGIVENSIVFVQTMYGFEEGKLNVFLLPDGKEYKISRTLLPGEYIGQAVASFTDLCKDMVA